MSSKVNDPYGYKNYEMKAIVDNLVCPFIEETLSKFHSDWLLIKEHDDVYEYKKIISLTMKRSHKDYAYLV